MVTYTEAWNIAFKTSKPVWKIWKYKISMFYKTNLKVEGKEDSTGVSFYSKDISSFNELLVANTLVKISDHGYKSYSRSNFGQRCSMLLCLVVSILRELQNLKAFEMEVN